MQEKACTNNIVPKPVISKESNIALIVKIAEKQGL
jgi:hypothetical protein